MCCLTIHKTKDVKLVITHNRDEQKSRQLSANQVEAEIINGRKIWMPKDALSTGTWIATDGQMVGALLNGFKENHIKKDKYKASRGNIIPELFEMESPERFIADFDPDGYEPFTLLIVDVMGVKIEYGWDEYQIHISKLNESQSYIYSSSTLYDKEVKSNREHLFFEWLKYDRSEKDVWQLHALKGNDHSQFLNVNYNDQIYTVAMSQIVLGETSLFHYQSIVADSLKKTLYLNSNKNIKNESM